MSVTGGRFDTFDPILGEFASPSQSLLTVNRREAAGVGRLLERAFDGQPVSVDDVEIPDEADDLVVLVEGGEAVAASPLQSVMDRFLLVNSDTYRTGDGGLDGDEDPMPEVLADLDDTVFELRGYPVSNKEKLLLVLVSRHIEWRALRAGAGRLRSTFQRLSRIDDERGTRAVYERLGETGVDVHVYGVPDWEVPPSLDVTVHAGTGEPYRRSWCVVYRPDDGHDGVALVALETGENTWRGGWTEDPALVRRTDRRVADVF